MNVFVIARVSTVNFSQPYEKHISYAKFVNIVKCDVIDSIINLVLSM